MMTLGEAARMVPGARLHGPSELRITGVSTDSRHIGEGDLFVALCGDTFDGHAYLDDVAARGAVAAIVSRDVQTHLPHLVVEDTRAALGHLARGWRARFDIPVVAVVGSNGKTTTKEMISAILAQAFGAAHRLATAGNLNNDIGVPLTLLRMRSVHQAAVVEIGMNHPGETAWLARIAAPTALVITNAQREHQEFMQSVEAVADEHALAIAHVAAQGSIAFPAPERYASVWRDAANSRSIIDFSMNALGVANEGAVQAVAHVGLFDTVVHFATPQGALTARIATAGDHNVMNAAAATAGALAAGIAINDIRLGLEAFKPVAGRMQQRHTEGGALLVDDSYNANPDSVRAAIEMLALAPAPRTLVLGDMGEVGLQGDTFHAEVGALAKARGIDQLIGVGAMISHSVKAFGEGATHFRDVPTLIAAQGHALRARNVGAILVKGSRFMGMERVIENLQGGSGMDRADAPGSH